MANLDLEDDHPHETHQIYPKGKDGYSHGVAKDEHQYSRAMPQAPSLSAHICPVDGSDQLWVIDITYMPSIRYGYCYCFNVVDVFNREWTACVFDTTMCGSNAIDALVVAAASRNPGKGLVLRLDNGTQFTSREFVLALRAGHYTRENQISLTGAEQPHRVVPRDAQA